MHCSLLEMYLFSTYDIQSFRIIDFVANKIHNLIVSFDFSVYK